MDMEVLDILVSSAAFTLPAAFTSTLGNCSEQTAFHHTQSIQNCDILLMTKGSSGDKISLLRAGL